MRSVIAKKHTETALISKVYFTYSQLKLTFWGVMNVKV